MLHLLDVVRTLLEEEADHLVSRKLRHLPRFRPLRSTGALVLDEDGHGLEQSTTTSLRRYFCREFDNHRMY